ncbi:MAG: hypothetical protein JW861_00325 [Bacteroidales bacterium]|nr:hypothetical protein [Bacteroidales bacterium]
METNSIVQYLIIGALALMVIAALIISFLFKPGRRLNVLGTLDPKGENERKVTVTILNTGKKQIRVLRPYLRFYHSFRSRIFQVKKGSLAVHFPAIMKPGEEVNFDIELSHYISILNKRSFLPTSVRVIMKDTIGLKFQTEKLPL